MTFHYIDALNAYLIAKANNDSDAMNVAQNRVFDTDYYDSDYESMHDFRNTVSNAYIKDKELDSIDDEFEMLLFNCHEDCIASDYVAKRLKNMTIDDIDNFVAHSSCYTSIEQRFELKENFVIAKQLLDSHS